MKIINSSKNKVIAANAVLCDSILSKFIGLMFSKNKRKCLVFKFDGEKIIALHMVFVFYPIDVMFLNKNKIIVEKKENFRPFTFYTPSKKAMYVVELPSGLIKKTKTEIRDKIIF